MALTTQVVGFRTLFIHGTKDEVSIPESIAAQNLAAVASSTAISTGTPPPPVVQFVTGQPPENFNPVVSGTPPEEVANQAGIGNQA